MTIPLCVSRKLALERAMSNCLWLKRAKKNLRGRKVHTSIMTELETAIYPMIKVFNRYTVIKGGDWRLGWGWGVKMLIERSSQVS